jgi:hypothetical protein
MVSLLAMVAGIEADEIGVAPGAIVAEAVTNVAARPTAATPLATQRCNCVAIDDDAGACCVEVALVEFVPWVALAFELVVVSWTASRSWSLFCSIALTVSGWLLPVAGLNASTVSPAARLLIG